MILIKVLNLLVENNISRVWYGEITLSYPTSVQLKYISKAQVDIFYHYAAGGTWESLPRVQYLQHSWLGKSRLDLQVLYIRIRFPRPFRNVTIECIILKSLNKIFIALFYAVQNIVGTTEQLQIAIYCCYSTDRPNSVRNRCVTEIFGIAFYVVMLFFGLFCGCRGFCHRTESDPFLFLLMNLDKRLFGSHKTLSLLAYIAAKKYYHNSKLQNIGFTKKYFWCVCITGAHHLYSSICLLP